CNCALLAPSSRASVGSATLMIVESRPTIKTLSVSAPSAHQRRADRAGAVVEVCMRREYLASESHCQEGSTVSFILRAVRPAGRVGSGAGAGDHGACAPAWLSIGEDRANTPREVRRARRVTCCRLLRGPGTVRRRSAACPRLRPG